MERVEVPANDQPQGADVTPPTKRPAKRHPAEEVSAVDDADESSGSQSKRMRTAAHDFGVNGSADELYEGGTDIQSSTYSPKSSGGSSEDMAENRPQPAHDGWNRGVNGGLRTSFGEQKQVQDAPAKSESNLRPKSAGQGGPHEGVEMNRSLSPEPIPSRPVLVRQSYQPRYLDLPQADKLKYLQRYFPGVGTETSFCVLCVSYGHSAEGCPDLNPDQEYRPIRIFPAVQKGGECARCHVKCHSETALWRTYEPVEGRIRKVKALTPSCFRCGENGHYGMDCDRIPSPQLCVPQRVWSTWSRWNFRQHMDPDATDEPLLSMVLPGSVPKSYPSAGGGRPDLGKSIVPQRHVVFEAGDDDEENDSLVRAPVRRNPGPGRINISATIVGTTLAGGKTVFPPLPPGPPPPLPSEAPASGKPKSKPKKNKNKSNNVAKNQQQRSTNGR